MSTSTQEHLTPVSDYMIRETGIVDVTSILGTGGIDMLRCTLNDLDSIRVAFGLPNNEFPWRPVSQDCYETNVNGIVIKLRLRANAAEIELFQHVRGHDLPTGIAPASQRACFQEINRLLALPIAQRLEEKLRSILKLRMEVVQVEQRNMIRLKAHWG